MTEQLNSDYKIHYRTRQVSRPQWITHWIISGAAPVGTQRARHTWKGHLLPVEGKLSLLRVMTGMGHWTCIFSQVSSEVWTLCLLAWVQGLETAHAAFTLPSPYSDRPWPPSSPTSPSLGLSSTWRVYRGASDSPSTKFFSTTALHLQNSVRTLVNSRESYCSTNSSPSIVEMISLLNVSIFFQEEKKESAEIF